MGRLAARHWRWFGLVLAVLLPADIAQADPQRYALVVGVREYPTSEKLSPLAFTEPDADEITAVLKNSGFQVILMTQTAAKPQGQQRLNPGAASIRRQFEGLVGIPGLGKDDCLLVVLEGHGMQLPSKTDAEKQTFYFCAADAQIDELRFSEDVLPQHNLIPVQELYDTLNQCEAGVKLLVVDACRNDPNKVDNFRSPNSLTRPPIPLPPGGIATLFSCSTNQRAAEDKDLQHGVFSHFFIEALSGKGDLDGDGQIDLTELPKYVSNRTYTHVFQKFGTRQLPEFKGEISGWAPLLALNAPSPAPMPTTTPVTMPMTTPPIPQQFAAGTKAGEARTVGGIKFCWCPPGQFTMGEGSLAVNVTLTKGFYLGQFELTQAEWEAVMGTNPWQRQTAVKEGSNYPATYVSWDAANAFCANLTGKGHVEGWLPKDWMIDLPTEAQWEYACRAGTTTRFSFGDDESRLGEHAWFSKNSNDLGEKYAHEVGLKTPNPWNLYDMHGNVWEWCQDFAADRLPGGTDPSILTSSSNKNRMDRGGSWFSFAISCGSAYRDGYNSNVQKSYLGFRLALVQAPTNSTPNQETSKTGSAGQK